MTQSGKVDNLRTFLLVSLLAVSLAGCMDTAPRPNPAPDPSSAVPPSGTGAAVPHDQWNLNGTADALARWNFTGASGEIIFESPDLSWFHIAYPETVHPMRVELEVAWRYDSFYPFGPLATMEWREEGDVEEQLQTPLVVTDQSATEASVGTWSEESHTTVGVDSVTNEAIHVLDSSTDMLPAGNWNASIRSLFVRQKMTPAEIDGFERPIRHYAVVNHSPIATKAPVTVRISWEHTPVALVWGSKEDHFAFAREDFSSDAQLGAKGTYVQAYATNDALLVAPLIGEEHSDLAALYWFDPRACVGACGLGGSADGTVVRPDGATLSGPVVAGSTDLAGPWTFQYPLHAHVEWQNPVLLGVRHAPLVPAAGLDGS